MMMDTVSHTENCKSPRIIKTHLPLAMLPPNLLEVSKVVVILRNVKDACASFYHHEQLLMNQGLDKAVSFEQYTDVYMKGEVLYGNYWDNLKVGSSQHIECFNLQNIDTIAGPMVILLNLGNTCKKFFTGCLETER